MKKENTVILLVCLFIAFQMMADIMSLRIVTAFGLSIDGGTLVYPLTFVVRDAVHRLTDKIVARQVVITAAVVNLIMIILFWIVAHMPADMFVGEQTSFGEVLLPAWRIVIASITAEIISGVLDGELYSFWGKIKPSSTWQRAIFSNLFSVPVDSAIFSLIAFYADLPMAVIYSIIISNILIKFAMAGAFTPIVYVRAKS